MITDCKICKGTGEVVYSRYEPPIDRCSDCEGNGYTEHAHEACDERAGDDEYCSDELADIAAGEHFQARGY